MNQLDTVAAVCHDQVVMDTVATARDNWQRLGAAIATAGHPDEVPEHLWRRALDTENVIATHTQAAITGCPCPQHQGPTWTHPESPSKPRPPKPSNWPLASSPSAGSTPGPPSSTASRPPRPRSR